MVRPDQAAIGDALLHLCLGDLLTIQLVNNDSRSRHSNHVGGRSSCAFLRMTAVVVLMRLCMGKDASSN